MSYFEREAQRKADQKAFIEQLIQKHNLDPDKDWTLTEINTYISESIPPQITRPYRNTPQN